MGGATALCVSGILPPWMALVVKPQSLLMEDAPLLESDW